VPPGVVIGAVVVGATLDDVLVSEEEVLDGLSESLPPQPTANASRAEPPSTAAAVLTWYGMGFSLSSRVRRTRPVRWRNTRGTARQNERTRGPHGFVANCYTWLQIATRGGGTCPTQPTGSLGSLPI
jgi:hypothetical protein